MNMTDFLWLIGGGTGTFVVLALWAIVLICLFFAPLIIWRNGNRTNRLLALYMLHCGVPANNIYAVYKSRGSDLPSGVYEMRKRQIAEEKTAKAATKAAANEAKAAGESE